MGTIKTLPPTLAFDFPSVNQSLAILKKTFSLLIGITERVPKAVSTKIKAETNQIAIIGLSCRFPGGANDPEAFWELLKQGYDGIKEIPPDRWDIDAYYDPMPDIPRKNVCALGRFFEHAYRRLRCAFLWN